MLCFVYLAANQVELQVWDVRRNGRKEAASRPVIYACYVLMGGIEWQSMADPTLLSKPQRKKTIRSEVKVSF